MPSIQMERCKQAPDQNDSEQRKDRYKKRILKIADDDHDSSSRRVILF
jgi:hypothetical protein